MQFAIYMDNKALLSRALDTNNHRECSKTAMSKLKLMSIFLRETLNCYFYLNQELALEVELHFSSQIAHFLLI